MRKRWSSENNIVPLFSSSNRGKFSVSILSTYFYLAINSALGEIINVAKYEWRCLNYCTISESTRDIQMCFKHILLKVVKVKVKLSLHLIL
jgi:hypothetical protein